MEENELRKKQEQAMREKLLAEEAKQQDPKVLFAQSDGLLLKKVCGMLKKNSIKAPLRMCRSKPRRRGSSSRS